MKTYSAFLHRIDPSAGQKANFTITVQAVISEMARKTAEAQYPGYKCASAPAPGALNDGSWCLWATGARGRRSGSDRGADDRVAGCGRSKSPVMGAAPGVGVVGSQVRAWCAQCAHSALG